MSNEIFFFFFFFFYYKLLNRGVSNLRMMFVRIEMNLVGLMMKCFNLDRYDLIRNVWIQSDPVIMNPNVLNTINQLVMKVCLDNNLTSKRSPILNGTHMLIIQMIMITNERMLLLP